MSRCDKAWCCSSKILFSNNLTPDQAAFLYAGFIIGNLFSSTGKTLSFCSTRYNPTGSKGFFFFFFNHFLTKRTPGIFLIYLFLAALSFRCCTRASSSCREQGLLFVVVRGLLIAWASLCCGARALGARAEVVVARRL